MLTQTLFGQIETIGLQNHSISLTLRLVNGRVYRIYDNDQVLGLAKPFDKIQVIVKSTGVPLVKMRPEIFKLIELLSFQRPFHQSQINHFLTQALHHQKFHQIIASIHLDQLEQILQDRKLSLLATAFSDVTDKEIGNHLIKWFQKLLDESDKFQYLAIKNHLDKYQLSLKDIDQASWKTFYQAIKNVIKLGQFTVEQIINLLEDHPYQLINQGKVKSNLTMFRIFDQIAGSKGQFQPTTPERQIAGLQSLLMDSLNQSNDCYVSQETLEKKSNLLFDSFPTVKLPFVNTYRIKSVNKLSVPSTNQEQMIYIPKYLDNAEKTIVDYVTNRISRSLLPSIESPIAIRSRLLSIDPDLSSEQLDIIEQCLTQPISIITGPPGVGKTRIISAIYRYLQSHDLEMILSAPTGLACKNMAKAIQTKIPHLYTIAKLIYSKMVDDQTNVTAPTSGYDIIKDDDVSSNDDDEIGASEQGCSLLSKLAATTAGLIIDETSMVDVSSFSRIIKALKQAEGDNSPSKELPVEQQDCVPLFRLILTGDPNQLPSIKPGKVLIDLIKSKRIPVYELKHSYRQSGGSLILSNAQKVLNGHVNLEIGPDFRTGRTHTDEETIALCLQLLDRIKAKDCLDDLIILTPYSSQQPLGSSKLNTRLKSYFNPNPPKKSWLEFSIGDRVLQIKNNYSKNLANGDLGYVTNICYSGSQMTEMTVDFPSTDSSSPNVTIKYSSETAREQLTLAYSISIHKSQGNGYPCVIIIIPQLYSTEFFNRNMLYTAITRAKKHVYLIGGNPDPSIHAIQRPRLTRLTSRLEGAIPPP